MSAGIASEHRNSVYNEKRHMHRKSDTGYEPKSSTNSHDPSYTLNSNDSFYIKEQENKWKNDENSKDIDKTFSLPASTRHLDLIRPSKLLSTKLIKENKELASPVSSTSIGRTRPIIETLMIEHDILHSKTRFELDRIKNTEENSKEVQCNLYEEIVRTNARAGTMKIKKKVPENEVLENLRKLCDGEFDILPQIIKIELIKAVEGHDNRKCVTGCIHLKRVANIKAKARSAPYPIKRSIIC
jgi:hypothetical protein